MRDVFMMGPAGSGKTALAVGLALRLRSDGYRVAYFKPVGAPPGVAVRHDEDAVLMKELLGMPQPLSTIVPFVSGPQYLSRYESGDDCVARVRECYAEVSADVDITIIGGSPWVHALASLRLDAISLAREFGAVAVVINRLDSDLSLDGAISLAESALSRGVDLAGIVFNHVPRTLLDKCEGIYRRLLDDRQLRLLGIVPWHSEIACPLVSEYYDQLGGEILSGEANMSRTVEDVLVGAMTLESAINYFRRSPNKAVITGGDRTDMALAALETSTSVLILTGGLYPSIRVLSRAAEKGVPVILTSLDTFSTIERMHQVSRRLRLDDRSGIQTACDLIDRFVDYDGLVSTLKE